MTASTSSAGSRAVVVGRDIASRNADRRAVARDGRSASYARENKLRVAGRVLGARDRERARDGAQSATGERDERQADSLAAVRAGGDAGGARRGGELGDARWARRRGERARSARVPSAEREAGETRAAADG